MKLFPNRRAERGETFHFMTTAGGRDLLVGRWCGTAYGRWYCVPCVEHVPVGKLRVHLEEKPKATAEHRMLWDCDIHGPEMRPDPLDSV